MEHTMSNGFDIATAEKIAELEDQGLEIHIHGPDDKPLYFTDDEGVEHPVTITVAGAHSSRCRSFDARLRKRKIKRNQNTLETFYEDNIERTAHCTLKWQGFKSNGVPVEMTRENAAKLYRSAGFILDQVVEGMNDHARFTQSSSN